MRLPEVQATLRTLAAELRLLGYAEPPDALAVELERLAGEMSRKPRATNGRPASVPTTPALRQRILQLRASEPSLTQHEIAQRLGTNQGRVSETLAGKRR